MLKPPELTIWDQTILAQPFDTEPLREETLPIHDIKVTVPKLNIHSMVVAELE